MLEEEARKRQIELAGTRSSDLSANLREGITGKATEKAAEIFGIGERYISDAKMIAQKAPEKLEQIRSLAGIY